MTPIDISHVQQAHYVPVVPPTTVPRIQTAGQQESFARFQQSDSSAGARQRTSAARAAPADAQANRAPVPAAQTRPAPIAMFGLPSSGFVAQVIAQEVMPERRDTVPAHVRDGRDAYRRASDKDVAIIGPADAIGRVV